MISGNYCYVIGPLFQTPFEAAKQAAQDQVHVLGLSTQAGGHHVLIPQLMTALKAEKAENIIIICGGGNSFPGL